MKQVSVLLPALTFPMDLVHSKLLPLLEGAAVRVIVYAHAPALKRAYFFEDEAGINARRDYGQSVDRWCEELSSVLKERSIDHNLKLVWERRLERDDLHLASANADTLLVVAMPQPEMMHTLRHLLRSPGSSVLVLFARPWRKPVALVAAVDPVHESDEGAARDVKVVKRARSLSRVLSGQLSIVHSCFVPSYLLSYRRKIDDIHHSNFEDFINDNQLGSLPHEMLHGEPAESLRAHVKAQKVDVLAMGSVARGIFDRYILGSTTEDILSNPPCDLLLIRS